MTSGGSVVLAEATRPELIFPALSARDGRGALVEIAEGIAAALPGVSPAALARGFAEREQLGSTALGGALAVPHCKVPGLERAYVAVGVSPAGIEFGAADGRPVRVFFAVVSPAAAPTAHLKLLAAISRWARTPGCLDRVVSAASTAELMAALDGGGG